MAATAASSYEYIVRRQRPGQKGDEMEKGR
jgi:hypothetical protein